MRRTYGSKTILYGTMKFAVSGDFFLKMMNHRLKGSTVIINSIRLRSEAIPALLSLIHLDPFPRPPESHPIKSTAVYTPLDRGIVSS